MLFPCATACSHWRRSGCGRNRTASRKQGNLPGVACSSIGGLVRARKGTRTATPTPARPRTTKAAEPAPRQAALPRRGSRPNRGRGPQGAPGWRKRRSNAPPPVAAPPSASAGSEPRGSARAPHWPQRPPSSPRHRCPPSQAAMAVPLQRSWPRSRRHWWQLPSAPGPRPPLPAPPQGQAPHDPAPLPAVATALRTIRPQGSSVGPLPLAAGRGELQRAGRRMTAPLRRRGRGRQP
mmetsp:Transcript_23139/g.47146  ORF Transcript_23139/g.47146 Transcript_23139/m.47146 type:complete len:236 (-) Transcript_23139:719-1426(-)